MTEPEILKLFRKARVVLVPTGCEFITAKECKRARRLFNKHLRYEFKLTAKEMLPSVLTRNQVSLLEAHHVVPLKLGGVNASCNLALVDPYLHKAIHLYIDKQVDALRPEEGDRFNLVIPMKLNLYWGL